MTLYYLVRLEVVVNHCCCCSHDQWPLTNHWHFQNCSVARRKETLKQNLTKKLSTKSKYFKKRVQETSLFTIVGFSIYKYNVVSENITKHCNLLKFTIVGFSIYKYNVVSKNRTKHCNLLKLFYYEGNMSSVLKLFVE